MMCGPGLSYFFTFDQTYDHINTASTTDDAMTICKRSAGVSAYMNLMSETCHQQVQSYYGSSMGQELNLIDFRTTGPHKTGPVLCMSKCIEKLIFFLTLSYVCTAYASEVLVVLRSRSTASC